MSSPTNVMRPITPQLPTYDPFVRFPAEIWQECFHLAISDDAVGPLPYLAVSTKWHETILDVPSLWTTIIIDDGEDQDARIYTFLYLSKTLLLDVEYRGCNGVPRIMEGCTSRIRSIIQLVVRPTDRNLSQCLAGWPKSGHTPSFPELKTLIDADGSTLSREFLLACPKLSIVRWVEVEMADEPYLTSTVKEVSFTRVEHHGLSKIIHRTNIQSLTLTCLPWPPLEEETNAQIAGWRAALGSVAISLGPQLQSLEMMFSLELFWEFISVLPDFSQLHSLDLQFLYTPTATRDVYILPLHVQRLKELTLNFGFYVTNVTESGKLALNATNVVLHSFVKEHPLKNLEKLLIISQSPLNGSLMGSLFQSTVNVKSIHLWIHDHYNLDVLSANHMPTLEELSVFSADLLHYFNPPNLMELRIMGRSRRLNPRASHINVAPEIIKLSAPGWIFDVNNAPSSPETFTLKHRYIELISSISPGVINRFSFLEEISFNDMLREREVVNDFLMEMLRNKGSCPRLHTIKSPVFPLWEPLFEVMRRRMTDSVQRITRLTLPGIPHIYLLRRLVQLLGGASNVYTTRNVDELIAKRSSCAYFHACTRCLDAGYIKCLYPNSAQSNLLVYEDERAIQDLLDFDSTTGSDYIRGYAWKDLDVAPEDSHMTRSRTCHGWVHGRTVDITGNTLDGVPISSWVS